MKWKIFLNRFLVCGFSNIHWVNLTLSSNLAVVLNHQLEVFSGWHWGAGWLSSLNRIRHNRTSLQGEGSDTMTPPPLGLEGNRPRTFCPFAPSCRRDLQQMCGLSAGRAGFPDTEGLAVWILRRSEPIVGQDISPTLPLVNMRAHKGWVWHRWATTLASVCPKGSSGYTCSLTV